MAEEIKPNPKSLCQILKPSKHFPFSDSEASQIRKPRNLLIPQAISDSLGNSAEIWLKNY